MNTSIFHKAVLLVAGGTALFVGGSILTSPESFYAAYDIAVAGNPSLVNELRAMGGSVVMLGLLTLAGLRFEKLTLASTLFAATMFIAFGATRLMSMGLDGPPHSGLTTAMIAELIIGGAALLALFAARKPA